MGSFRNFAHLLDILKICTWKFNAEKIVLQKVIVFNLAILQQLHLYSSPFHITFLPTQNCMQKSCFFNC